MASATHHHEESSTRGWSIRIPRRDVMLVVAALALGGGGGGAAWRFLAGGPAGATEMPRPSQERMISELAQRVTALEQRLGDVAAGVGEMQRVQRVQSRNDLLLCEIAARMARRPNPCVEP